MALQAPAPAAVDSARGLPHERALVTAGIHDDWTGHAGEEGQGEEECSDGPAAPRQGQLPGQVSCEVKDEGVRQADHGRRLSSCANSMAASSPSGLMSPIRRPADPGPDLATGPDRAVHPPLLMKEGSLAASHPRAKSSLRAGSASSGNGRVGDDIRASPRVSSGSSGRGEP